VQKRTWQIKRRFIGVLGGMGPLATVDFLQKVINATSAEADQDHVPLLVHSVPQIADRSEAIISGSDEPFPALLAGVRLLERSGAELIVIPCNSAHAWFDRLAAATNVRLLHIAEAVRAALEKEAEPERQKIALMATAGTVRAGFYQRCLATAKREIVTPSPEMQQHIGSAIVAVKSGDIAQGRELATKAGRALIDSGANSLLLACTELPVALQGTELEALCIDATACLAAACVTFSLGAEGSSQG
jgi:aspartate racemase